MTSSGSVQRGHGSSDGNERTIAGVDLRIVSNSVSVAPGVSCTLSKASNHSAWHDTQ